MNDCKTKSLILCTAEFPFGYGESFLETELEYIASTFDHVFILPDHKSDRVRTIPENVCIIDSKYYKISAVQVFVTLFTNLGILKEFTQNMWRKPFLNRHLLSLLRKALLKKRVLVSVIKKHHLEQLHLYSYWLDHSALALSLLKINGTAISRVHSWDVYEERHRFGYLPLRKFIIENLSAVYCISNDALRYLSNKYEVDDKLVLSRLGTSTNSNLSSFDGEFKTMLSVSNFAEVKRIDLIGEIYTKYFKHLISWHHIGSGDELNNYKARFGSEVFLGQLANSEVHESLESYRNTSFLINLSAYEGIPVSMMEAMSYGIPCIGTNVGGVGEIIENGVNGFLLSANPGEQEVSEAITKILSMDSETAKTMRQNARNTWKRKFNAETNFKEFVEKLKCL